MRYKITIHDEMFSRFTGEFIAQSQQEAIKEAQEFYGLELDTLPQALDIVSIEPIQ